MKKYLYILIYLSFIFLIIYIIRIDYASVSLLQLDAAPLLLSFFFLFLGFILSAFSWKSALSIHGHSISYGQAIASHGLPIFSKYIPGKLWTVVGRAGIIKTKIQANTADITMISLKEQLIFIWTGFLLGCWFSMVLLIQNFSLIYITFFVFLSAFLFIKPLHQLVISALNRILKKRKIQVPYLKIEKLVPLVTICISYWLCWAIGFYFVIKAIYPDNFPLYGGLIFPFSAVIGLLAVIVPGGIGIREGIMVIGLIYLGIEPDISTSISILSRIWFLIGEALIFTFGFLFKKV